MAGTKKLLAVGFLLLIFLAGFGSGYLTHHTVHPTVSPQKKQHWRGRRGRHGRRKSWSRRFVAKMTKRLGLDKKQQQAMATILKKHRPTYRLLRKTYRTGRQELRRKLHNDIFATLQPEQKKKFKRWMEE
jgi:hypothetical protein